MEKSKVETDDKTRLIAKKRKTSKSVHRKTKKSKGKPRGRNGGRKAIGNNLGRSSRSLYCNKQEYQEIKMILELMHITSDLNDELNDEKKWHSYIDFCIKKNNDLDDNVIKELKSSTAYVNLRIMTINTLFSDNTPIELYKEFVTSEKNSSLENKER